MKAKAVAALAALGATLSAQASPLIEADAQIGHLSYELIDTDLNDGITPAISFQPGAVFAWASVQRGTSSPPLYQQQLYTLDSLEAAGQSWQFESASIATGGGKLSSNLQRSLQDSVADLSTLTPEEYAQLRAKSFLSYKVNFRVTPNTDVIFKADATVGAAADTAGFKQLAAQWLHSDTDRLEYEALAKVGFGEPSAENSVIAYGALLGDGTTSFTPGDTKSLPLSFFYNHLDFLPTGKDRLGSVTLTSEMEYTLRGPGNLSPIPSVPEPSHHALTGVGLAAVAAAVRRQGRRARGR